MNDQYPQVPMDTGKELQQQIQVGVEQADQGEMIDHDTVFSQLRAIAVVLIE